MKIKTASGLMLAYLNLFKFDAVATLWDTIYVRPGFESHSVLLLHEQEHIRQMQSEGKFKFTAKYLWYLLRYGYWNNPYEVQAREASYRLN